MSMVAIMWRPRLYIYIYIILYLFIDNPSYNINNFFSSDSACDEKSLFELFNLHIA